MIFRLFTNRKLMIVSGLAMVTTSSLSTLYYPKIKQHLSYLSRKDTSCPFVKRFKNRLYYVYTGNEDYLKKR
jgi:hypothetical protein